MERQVGHVDMDTFYVSAVRLLESNLIGKPVLVGGMSDRAVVAACSYEARRFGVYSGMPMKQALRLCPEAIVRQGDFDYFSRKSQAVTDMLIEAVPVVQKASIDEHYLDFTGFGKYFDTLKYVHELRVKVMRETGLPLSLGLSVNKTVSKIATGLAKPNGELPVSIGQEKSFLAPLSVRKIPGVGGETYRELSFLGIQLIRNLQEMDVSHLERALGENGVTIWNKAHARDDSPVIPYREQKSISKERTFQSDTTDPLFLKKTFIGMVNDLAFELRDSNRLTSCITVKLRYSDWDNKSIQCRIPHTSIDDVLIEKTLDLFNRVNSRRQLIRLVGVKFSDFAYGNYQINLFDDTETNIKLYQALDSIRKRFGTEAVMKAVRIQS